MSNYTICVKNPCKFLCPHSYPPINHHIAYSTITSMARVLQNITLLQSILETKLYYFLLKTNIFHV